MNLAPHISLLSELLYLFLTSLVVFKVGKICYTNGSVYVLHFIPKHPEFCLSLNRLLLFGYYLVTNGYVLLTVLSWNYTENIVENAVQILYKLSVIVLIIGALHCINLYWIYSFIHTLI